MDKNVIEQMVDYPEINDKVAVMSFLSNDQDHFIYGEVLKEKFGMDWQSIYKLFNKGIELGVSELYIQKPCSGCKQLSPLYPIKYIVSANYVTCPHCGSKICFNLKHVDRDLCAWKMTM